MILVDTSIWIDHLRASQPELERLIGTHRLVMHPFVIAELALGHITRRGEFLDLLAGLPAIATVGDGAHLSFVEANALFGTGIGFVDSHLLASTWVADGVRLWSRDRRLAEQASRLGLAYDPLS